MRRIFYRSVHCYFSKCDNSKWPLIIETFRSLKKELQRPLLVESNFENNSEKVEIPLPPLVIKGLKEN